MLSCGFGSHLSAKGFGVDMCFIALDIVLQLRGVFGVFMCLVTLHPTFQLLVEMDCHEIR
jgi:hypothetical protein